MPKYKMAAGKEFETLNKSELHDVLKTVTQDWFNQVGRGDRYRRISAAGAVAGGAVSIGGPDQSDTLGPKDGFVWDVRRLAVSTLGASDTLQVFLNDNGPSSLVHPAMGGFLPFDNAVLVMYPGDALLFTGTGLTAVGTLTVTGQVREIPMPLAWRIGS